jgi:hypothetical protein
MIYNPLIKYCFAEDLVPINHTYVHYVEQLSDLPTPIGNVITIPTGHTYIVVSPNVNIGGNRLYFEKDSCLLGTSSATSKITCSLGNGEAMITAEGSLPMQDITLECNYNGIGALPSFMDLNGISSPGANIDWLCVNFTGNVKLGSIRNYSNVVLEFCKIVGQGGELFFEGTFDNIIFQACYVNNNSTSGRIIHFSNSLTINSRIRFTFTPFNVSNGMTGIHLGPSAIIPVEGYQFQCVSFEGPGTPLSGVLPSNNKSFFLECRGVQNSTAIAEYYMTNNTINTVIGTGNTGVFRKVEGITFPGVYVEKFTLTNNRATYTGALTRKFKVTAQLSLSSTNAQNIAVAITKNNTVINSSITEDGTDAAGRLQGMGVQTIVELNTNDYIEIFVSNNSSTANVLVKRMNVIIEALN